MFEKHNRWILASNLGRAATATTQENDNAVSQRADRDGELLHL